MLLFVAVATAHAVTPAPQTIVGKPYAPLTVCVLGEAGEPGTCDCLPDLGPYSVLLEASNECCTPLTTAHVAVGFNGACHATARIRIVGAAGSAGCRYPDPGTELTPLTDYDLSGPESGVYDFAMPLPAGACITGPAFLEVALIQGQCLVGISKTALTPPPCHTYWGERDVTGFDCTASISPCIGGGNSYTGSDPVIYAEADCCNPVPALRRSWGDLKVLYR